MQIIFYCCPKPFIPEFKQIQTNAISSWLNLKSTKKVVVFGNEEGIVEFTERNSCLVSKPNIKYSPRYGTPILSSIFGQMKKDYANECDKTNEAIFGCYINSDIILTRDFENTLKSLIATFPNHPSILGIGQRINYNVSRNGILQSSFLENLDTEKIKEDSRFKLHGPNGIDYFIFEKDTFTYVPDFCLGKFFWDVWLVGNCYRRNIWVLDLTKTVTAIHQDSPWFMGGEPVYNQELLRSSSEGVYNVLYENYAKNITTGSKGYSEKIGSNIYFRYYLK